MVPQWPLPRSDRKTVALLPVMRRMEVRERVLADKLRQRGGAIRQKVRDADYERFVCRGGG
eukprot:6892536-Prymnesium_polylepis.1